MTAHTAESLATLLESKFPGIALDADMPGPLGRFEPSTVAYYLCDIAGPSASIGAIHNYVWAMALTPRAGAARHALRNLAGLIETGSQ